MLTFLTLSNKILKDFSRTLNFFFIFGCSSSLLFFSIFFIVIVIVIVTVLFLFQDLPACAHYVGSGDIVIPLGKHLFFLSSDSVTQKNTQVILLIFFSSFLFFSFLFFSLVLKFNLIRFSTINFSVSDFAINSLI